MTPMPEPMCWLGSNTENSSVTRNTEEMEILMTPTQIATIHDIRTEEDSMTTTTPTPARRALAAQRLHENFEAARLYQPTPHATDADMLVLKAERNLDQACRMLGYTVEKPSLGFSVEDARRVVYLDVGSLRNVLRQMVRR